MKVLLIGGTGLLGHHVLKCLTERGFDVVAMVRRADGIQLESGEWQTVEGSPLDYGALLHAAEGCEAVVNCAGMTDMSLRQLKDYMPANHELPRLIVQTMETLGIKRLVHVSTVNTIGNGSAESPASENAPMAEPFSRSLYAMSKREGEDLVLNAARQHADWHVVVVCPGFMIGSYDVKPSSGRLLLAAYGRRLILAPKGGKAFVAARDVAEAVVNAIDRGKNGQRYIVTNSAGCHTIKELYEIQSRVMGYRQRVLLLPNWVLTAAGWLGEGLRWLGMRTELSLCNVRQLMAGEYYDNGLGLCDLKYFETPIDQAIAEFYQWRNSKHQKR